MPRPQPQSPSRRPAALLLRTPHLRWIGLAAALRQHARVCIVGEADSLEEACAGAAAAQPDLIVLDADGPPPPVVARARRLHTASPTSRLVVLGDEPHLDPFTLRALHAVGLAAYVLWAALDADALLLARCLPVVLHTPVRLLPGPLLDELTTPERRQHPRTTLRALTDPERLVLQRLLQGWTRDEIARREAVSRSTVDRLTVKLQAFFGVTTPCALGVQATLLGFADALERDPEERAAPTAPTAPNTAPHRADDYHQPADDFRHIPAEFPQHAAERRHMS